MRKIFFILFLLPLLSISQKACPDCYGYGAVATGGRGGVLGIVTTLDEEAAITYNAASGGNAAYYTGGFNNLMQQSDVGPIVFNVSGNIYLADGTGNVSGYRVTFAYAGMPNVRNKTVYGQSAPQGGITFTNGTFALDYPRNLIMMHLRSRPIYNKAHVVDATDDASTWGFHVKGADSLYLKNLTASYSQDKNIGGYIDEIDAASGEYLRNITQDMCLAYDGNTNSYWAINEGRPNNPQGRTYNISFIRNGNYVNNRTPNMAFDGRGDIINNVNIDADYYFGFISLGTQLNYVNNYHQSYSSSYGLNSIKTNYTPLIYSSGNVGDFANTTVGDLDETSNQQHFFAGFPNEVFPPPSQFFTGTRFSASPYPLPEVSASQARTDLVVNKNIGSTYYMSEDGYLTKYNDPRDDTMLTNMANNVNFTPFDETNWTLPTIASTTHDATYDTDWDGLPDDWEVRHFGDLTSNSYNDDPDADGWTNIEEAMYGTDPNELVQNPSYGYTVVPYSGLITTESGGTDDFSVVLNEQPVSNVVFNVVSNNMAEGTISPSTLTFTTVNWATPQTVTITGVNDDLDDGNQVYTVTVSVDAASSDDNYDSLADVNVEVTNLDNDAPTPTAKRVSKHIFQIINN